MTLKDGLLALFDREVAISKKVLANVPPGKFDWKPHEKSMPFGYLAQLVATMPSWIAMAIAQDELDLKPPSGAGYEPPDTGTNPALLKAFDDSIAQGREALRSTTDEHLATPWKLLVGGHVVMENPRHVVIADTFTHLAHHRGQLTVYLRLLNVPVPSIYGPSADDARF
jgi:uncharacterized damage-inducible protein DinB